MHSENAHRRIAERRVRKSGRECCYIGEGEWGARERRTRRSFRASGTSGWSRRLRPPLPPPHLSAVVACPAPVEACRTSVLLWRPGSSPAAVYTAATMGRRRRCRRRCRGSFWLVPPLQLPRNPLRVKKSRWGTRWLQRRRIGIFWFFAVIEIFFLLFYAKKVVIIIK